MKCRLLLFFCLLKIENIIPIQPDSTPTVSRLYGDYFIAEAHQNPAFSDSDYDAYLAQIDQFFDDEGQGTIDCLFGSLANNSGIQIPCNGICGFHLQQKIKSIQELASGQILIGMNGKLDTSNSSNMMLGQLTADGLIDTTFGSNGFINLPQHQSNENLVSMVQDFFLNLYVVGYASTGSIVRKYNPTGAELWVADNNVVGSYVMDVALQGTTRLLVAHQLSQTEGELAAYNLETGEIDTTFYNHGVVPGVVTSPDFGLNIGQLYGVVVNLQQNIFILYKNNATGYIDLAALYADGRGLISQFSHKSINPGVIYNVFSSIEYMADTEPVLALDNYNNLVAAISTGAGLVFVRFDGQTGNYDQHFNSTGTVIIPSIGNSIVIENLIGLSDGSMMLVGHDQATALMLVVKITIAGQLDITFNSQGENPGIAYFTIDNQQVYGAQCFMGLGIQSSTGNIIIGGYTQKTADDALSIVMRLHGQSGTTEVANDLQADAIPGTLDCTINTISDGLQDLSLIEGWSQLSGYAACAVLANSDGTMYIACGDGNNIIVGLIDANMYPVITFGNNGLSTPQSMSSIQSLVVGAADQILVAGIDQGLSKIMSYTSLGTVATAFASEVSLTNCTAIAEQKSGVIIVGGSIDSLGVVVGYQNDGQNIVASFGSLSSAGYFVLGTDLSVDDLVIDNQDTIYAIYRNSMNQSLYLEKLMPNGSCNVALFNNGNAVDTGMIAINQAHIAINSNNNIVVAAPTEEGIQFCLYDGSTGIALSSLQTIPLTCNYNVTKIVGSGTDFVGCGCRQDGQVIVFRILGSTGLLDTNFGLLQNGIMMITSDELAVHSISVQLDGRIVLVGSDGTSPLLVRLQGYSYIDQYPQMPGKAPAGTLDTTLFYIPPVVSDKSMYKDTAGTLDTSYGAFNFEVLATGGFDVTGFTMKHIYGYRDGLMLFVCDNGTDTIIFRLLNNVSLDTLAHGGLGFHEAITPGYIKLYGHADPTGLYVNEQGTIFIAGGSGASWAFVFNSDGSPSSRWTLPVDNLAGGAYQVGVQSCGRIIVAGQDISHGVLYGYTPTGDLDLSFGVNGIVSTGVTAPITDISIDNLDRIVICYVVAGSSIMQRVNAQGTTITTLDTGTAITNITGNELKIVQDLVDNIVLAAATSTGFSARRYDSSGANNPTEVVTITVGSGTSHLGNIYVTSDNKVGFVGYETTENVIVCARLDASFLLDATFNGGVAVIATDSPMNTVYDATIYVDSRIMIVGGSTITPDPYMARIFGDAYFSVIPQSALVGIPCTNDLTFGPNATNGINFYAASGGTSQLQVAQSVSLKDEENIVIALDGQSTVNADNRIFMSMFTVDGQPQRGFGGGGTVEIPHTYQNEYVRDILLVIQDGVACAILVGYLMNSSLGIIRSLLIKYNLDTATVDTKFGGFDGDPQGFASGAGQAFYGVSSQSHGRIIAAGLDSAGSGLLAAYTLQGKLDRSFGLGGLFHQGSTGIYSHVVDTLNRIVVAYNDGAHGVAVARIVPNGSGLDFSFNPAGATPGIISASDRISGFIDNKNVRIAIDHSNNIIVAAVVNSGLDYAVARYTFDGVLDRSFSVTSAMLGGTTSLSIAKLLVDTQGNITIIGSDHAVSDHIVITQLLSDLSGLNPAANSAGTPGYIKYAVASGSRQVVTDALIHPDGRIIVVGAES